MAWLSPLPFVVPALAILMLLVLSEELARFLYDTFSPLWVPSFFVLGGLNIALFTLRYDFPQADCSRAYLTEGHMVGKSVRRPSRTMAV